MSGRGSCRRARPSIAATPSVLVAAVVSALVWFGTGSMVPAAVPESASEFASEVASEVAHSHAHTSLTPSDPAALTPAALTPAAFPSAAFSPPEQPVVGSLPEGWPDVDLEVAAHLLLDAETGQVLAAHNEDERRPVASTVKILTALSVVERTELTEEVTVGPEVEGVPGSGVELAAGATWTVEELLEAMLVRSGNNAAIALATHVAGSVDGFVELMLEDAERLGIHGVTLVSVSGLDDDNSLSATDLGVLARAALDDPQLASILAAETVELPSEGLVDNRNELLFSYPGATGVKTGFTDAAGNSVVASARRDGRELIAVVLGAGADPARFDAATDLLDLGFDGFASVDLAGELTVRVGGGEVVHAIEPLSLTAPVDQPPTLTWPIPSRPQDSLTVPVMSGTTTLTMLAAPVVAGSPRADSEPNGEPGSEPGSASLGRAIADGVYAALRTAVADDASGSLWESSEGASS